MDITQLFSPADDSDAPRTEDLADPAAAPADSLDSILDDLDSMLETNAEAFVQGFVQKGGQ